MPNTREKLTEMLQRDNCPLFMVFGELERLVDYLLANGVTVEEWILVAEEMPKEHESVVPGLGTFSDRILVTWLDPTSPKPYPENSFVREGCTRNGEFTLSHINGDLVPVAWKPLPKPCCPPKKESKA